ncbi:MAG TPA: aminotransferase class I/II-fold pyridoxal phosphate-dependent enzyme [Candidatus Sulfotelmatobacter sp.]|nr:aminotransferase class I/II-fold pyridoxal phosphate-dependent enzyme [Candidatus Sulfotelmatobacter sp.]
MRLYQPSMATTRVTEHSLRPQGGAVSAGTVSVSQGEPDFDTPEIIVNAMHEAIDRGWTHYGDSNGDPELRDLIAEQASKVAGRAIGADSVAITHGGAGAISASVLATVNPGETVVIPEPTYSLYPDAVRLAGGKPVFVPCLKNNQLDIPALLEAARGSRLIAFCNPGNPTGAVFPRETLLKLAEGLRGSSTLVLVDEAYAHLTYGAQFESALAIEELWERLIYVQTLSKTYAMTGWRLGYAIAHPQLVKSIRTVHRTFNSAPNAAVQRAAIAALKCGPEVTRHMLDSYQERRDLVVSRLAAIPGISFTEPEGAFYVFFSYPGNRGADEMLQEFENNGVKLRAGTEFGPSGEGHMRLSFATDPDTLNRALDCIELTVRKAMEVQRA